MSPTPGDIYVCHNGRLDAYVAFQITHVKDDGALAVLTLDWSDVALPDDAALAAMKPAVFDFMYWTGRHQHCWVGATVPRQCRHVGWRPPLVTDEVRSYSAWPDGSLLGRQRWWQALDPALVRAFKAAADGPRDQTVVLEADGRTVTRGTSRLDSALLNAAPSLSVFDALPLLGELDVDTPVPGLLPWLRTRPLITELDISGQHDPVLDVRGTHLLRLSVDVTGMREIFLNDGLNFLFLRGKASPDLILHGEQGGRYLSVQAGDAELPWSGLPELEALSLRGMRSVDAGIVAARLPSLRQLRIWGGPCVMQNLDRLGELSKLSYLTLTDVFPPAGSAFPAPSCWPGLSTLWLQSIPTDLAAAVKKAYRGEAAKGLDLSVKQPRKPEWLAANLDNPFREWDGSDVVTPAQAKKAATLYRKARADALKLAADLADDADGLVEALTPVVHAYTEGFNAMDRRAGFIDTVAREQIYMAWVGIVQAVEEKRRESLGSEVAPLPQAVLDAMDEVRDF
ncbi:gliding motility protein [Bordetella genomosp. 13]|uniref:gliding motility protein n=1 Tax=Bordetella genomosp. 13 TaxID=463040 RepID=UPI0011A6DD86|nr:gliding motility protein [Bordetella genomosp. 13]